MGCSFKICKPTSLVEKSKRNLYFTVLSLNLLCVASGSALAWTSPAIPKLLDIDSPVLLTITEAIRIGYIFCLGCILGPISVCYLSDRFGRKLASILIGIVFLISWIILYFAKSIIYLYLARLLQGALFTAVLTVVPIYISEISDPEMRVALGCTLQCLSNLGYLIGYGIGPFVSYPRLIEISSVSVILFLFCAKFIKETPYFFMSKGEQLKAKQSLQWYRCEPSINKLENELIEIENCIKSTKSSRLKLFVLLSKRSQLTALALSLGLFALAQVSGVIVLLTFLEPILMSFEDDQTMMHPSSITKFTSLTVGLIKVIFAIFIPYLAKKYGSKKLLIISCSGISISMFVLGLISFLKNLSDSNQLSIKLWMVAGVLIIYFIFMCTGAGFLPFVITAELLAPEVKSIGMSIAIIFNFIISFIFTSLFVHVILNGIYVHLMLWFFSIFTGLGILFTKKCVPDTKNMTLNDIQDWLNNRYNSNS